MSTTTTYPVFTPQELKCILTLAEAGAKITDTIGPIHLTDLIAKVTKFANPVRGSPEDWTPRTVHVRYSMINKIGAIKIVRTLTGWGLKEALDSVTEGSPDGRRGELILRNVSRDLLEKLSPSEYISWEIINDS